MLVGAITTLQKSSQFKNLFDWLEFTTNERRMATEALVSIASGVGIKCLTTETQSDWAFLEGTNKITFSDEDMEVGYPHHRRTLYFPASKNQIPIKQTLVDVAALVNLIPFSTLQVVGIPKNKIQGYPIEVTRFGGKGKYTTRYIQLWLKVGKIASLAHFHMVKIEVLYNILLGWPWLHKHHLIPSMYH